MIGSSPSRGLVRCFEQVLDEDLLRKVLEEAAKLNESPNYWIRKEHLKRRKRCQYPAEKAIRSIHATVPLDLPEDIAGAEYWVQVYEPGKGLNFHFDKDEGLLKASNEMKHPLLSCILYLTGDKTQPRLGPTVVIDQRYDNVTRTTVPASPTHCAFVWPSQNMLAIFDGALGHGVLESPVQDKRVTMLINWWAHQPAAVFERPRMTDVSSKASEQEAGASGATTCDPDMGQPEMREGKMLALSVPEGPEDTAITVDDLLEGHGAQICSKDAIAALEVKHEGFQLYPVSSDQGDQFTSLATAAAFVSNGLLDSDSDD